ncbi:helix-turn-helix domain-containing protein [Nocardioides nitrophenolicus]|uniref:helix-turn-helix domain-containing protein n=1 Tax=Nocardioides nitrophenolicus TaxID=60489 RepID=UPI0019599705|nr:helix-turn-helix transcriptional regulator [Nocardioides nitrophenolicus]MBM7518599.1 plasmid maintenance system antidote protein VapI [Nocardioides nitrophenolicus]
MTETTGPVGVADAVTTNLDRLARHPDAAGLRELDGLVRQLGEHGLARRHLRLERAGSTGARRVHALFELLRDEPRLRRLLARGERAADTLVLRLHEYAAWLVAIGLQPHDGPRIAGELTTLRAALAPLLARPWGDQDDLVADAVDLLGAEAADAVRCIQEVRQVIEVSNERRVVSEMVRGYVDRSGLTQREFAHRIGTSPSRLSAYVNGGTVPSAALMLRMQRVAGRGASLAVAG